MTTPPNNMVKRRKTENGAVSDELNTEGLPPNAVDEDGNILVTDFDILYVNSIPVASKLHTYMVHPFIFFPLEY
jgi:hypothetical protein